jgi:NodT family efflux transporter outer membrane factor (OMF) lipoprotein
LRSGDVGQSTFASGATINDYLAPLTASWSIDVWGRVRRQVEAGTASAQASAALLQSVRLLTQAQVAQNYFQLRTLDAQKKLLEETTIAYQTSLKLTQNRYASGVASRADVLQAETLLKSTQAQAIDIGVQRAQLEHAIALLLGKPAPLFSIPVVPLSVVPPAIPVGVPSELLERRPDIAAAERNMAAANAQIGVAKAAFYPTVTLNGSAGFESSDLSNWLTWPSRFWSLGTGISEAVFEGGLRRAQTAAARAAYDATVASYRQTVLTAFQQVEDNLAALRILEGEAQVQQGAVQAARQSVTVALNQYKAGTVNYLTVVVVQAAALNNEITAVNIQNRRMTAAVNLIQALGGGWSASELPTSHDLQWW